MKNRECVTLSSFRKIGR